LQPKDRVCSACRARGSAAPHARRRPALRRPGAVRIPARQAGDAGCRRVLLPAWRAAGAAGAHALALRAQRACVQPRVRGVRRGLLHLHHEGAPPARPPARRRAALAPPSDHQSLTRCPAAGQTPNAACLTMAPALRLCDSLRLSSKTARPPATAGCKWRPCWGARWRTTCRCTASAATWTSWSRGRRRRCGRPARRRPRCRASWWPRRAATACSRTTPSSRCTSRRDPTLPCTLGSSPPALPRFLVAAPRCYCLLTHYPFFALHLKAGPYPTLYPGQQHARGCQPRHEAAPLPGPRSEHSRCLVCIARLLPAHTLMLRPKARAVPVAPTRPRGWPAPAARRAAAGAAARRSAAERRPRGAAAGGAAHVARAWSARAACRPQAQLWTDSRLQGAAGAGAAHGDGLGARRQRAGLPAQPAAAAGQPCRRRARSGRARTRPAGARRPLRAQPGRGRGRGGGRRGRCAAGSRGGERLWQGRGCGGRACALAAAGEPVRGR